MADFPLNPIVGTTFTAPDGTVWTWDGYSWKSSGGLGGSPGSSLPEHPADGIQYGLDATAIGDPTLMWRRYADQNHFLTFDGGLTARFSGGAFSGTQTAEKGYTGAISFTYSVSQPTVYSISDSYDAKLNGSFITMDGATGSGNTGNSTSTATYTGPVSEPASFSVILKSNTNETSTETSGLTWLYRVYWGADAGTSLTEAQVEALTSSQLKSGRTGTYTITATGGKYLYICYPASYGAATQFTVNGFVTTFQLLTSTLSVTNAYGATTDYRVYRSEDLQSGSGIPVVVS
jgi:hypothetical protein